MRFQNELDSLYSEHFLLARYMHDLSEGRWKNDLLATTDFHSD